MIAPVNLAAILSNLCQHPDFTANNELENDEVKHREDNICEGWRLHGNIISIPAFKLGRVIYQFP